MNKQISLSTIYHNVDSLGRALWRAQALDTLDDLLLRSSSTKAETLAHLDSMTEDEDLDDVEETFYADSVEEIAERYDITLIEEEEEE